MRVFYPNKKDKAISVKDNRLANTKDAKIILANIPFVSLRHGLPEELLKGSTSYSQSVLAVKSSFAPPMLKLNPKSQIIIANVVQLKLPASEFALLSLFARRALMNKTPIQAPAKDVPDLEWGSMYLKELEKISGRSGHFEMSRYALRNGMDGDYFSSKLSKLRSKINKALGQQKATPYLIDDGGTSPRQYRLTIKAEHIEFISD